MENRNVSMITKSMELLELLSEHPQGLTLQEIVGLLDYPKSSIYKIATNLLEIGYIGREPGNFRYFLSRKLLLLGLKAVSSYDIIEMSEEYMKRLR
ncbi:MAG: helix-turn-helix domain-containing protein, partial [Dysgonomonas mossii]|nr:helix-turn-helix domain-containing protein [Dysgonomonas mossii]